MKNFLTVLCLSVFTVSAYGETFCESFEPGGGEDVSGREWLSAGGGNKYFYCGYLNSGNGCPDGAEVHANGYGGWGIYHCYGNAPTWAYVDPERWIADCGDDPYTERANHDSGFCSGEGYVYFANGNENSRLYNICKIEQSLVEYFNDLSRRTGGIIANICGTRFNCPEEYGLRYSSNLTFECECIDADAHLDQINGTKLCVKGNFYACETDADCLGGRTPVKPSHSTAWRCVNQKYDVKVCAATACENGWHVKQGYGFCEQDASTQTVVQTPVSPTLPGNTPDDITAPVQTPNCSDPINMDADCKCTRVAETVERGGVCVCADSNKEIKNGKCEYTAAYRSTLKADIDSKYSKIKSLTASFEVNKWKDAEGNFNTARLASDSIAGVVLGTAGGIITSKLVKKNQLKKGFEDIQCHIGGQSVADYGDEFTVGR